MQFRLMHPNATNAWESVFLVPYIFLFDTARSIFKREGVEIEIWGLVAIAIGIVTIDFVATLALVTGTWDLFFFVVFWGLVLYALGVVYLTAILSTAVNEQDLFDDIFC